MKALLLASLLLINQALPAAESARWEEVLLLDWVYPGQESYEALKSASTAAGNGDWLAARMSRNEKIPQASAKELAFRLTRSASIDPANKEKLKKLFADDVDLLKEIGENDRAKRAHELSEEFDKISQKMDEIDTIHKTNLYGKGANPSSTLEVFAGYRLDSPAGMMSGNTQSGILGGIGFALDGTIDKVTYNFSLTIDYNRADDLLPYSVLGGHSGGTFSFVLPLGNGGFDFQIGGLYNVRFDELLFAAPAIATRDLFFIDMTQAFRPAQEVKELDLGYPSAEAQWPGIIVGRQGATMFWPFTRSQFIYAPIVDFWESYSIKENLLALRLDEELGPRGHLFDNVILYGIVTDGRTDADELRGVGITTQPTSVADCYGLGGKLQLSTGSAVDFEAAVSHYQFENITIPKYHYSWDDSAYIASLIQPVGPFTVALVSGMAGPRFVTGPNGSISGGTLNTSWTDPYTNAKAPDNLGWRTNIQAPASLVNNTQQYVAKLQWTGSWLSLGLYDGIVNQINPSGPEVFTNPYIEGYTFNGYGWYRMLGQQYGGAPPPGSPVPAITFTKNPLGGITTNLPTVYMARYNLPTDGATAKTEAKTPLGLQKVHWYMIEQKNYRQADFYVLLSQNGVGDQNIMADSVKTLNYGGGTVKLDLKSLFTRVLPFEVDMTGEVRDLAAQTGIPAFDDSNYFNQQVYNGFLIFGLTDKVDLRGMAGYETWRCKQSFYPLFVQIRELGLGADLNLDPLLTGLKLNIRSSWFNHEDMMVASREFSLWTLGIGSTLTY